MIDVLVKREGRKEVWARSENEQDAVEAMSEQGYRIVNQAWETITRWECIGPQNTLTMSVVTA